MSISVMKFYEYLSNGFSLIIKLNLFSNIVKCELSNNLISISVRKDLAQRQIKLGRISLYKRTCLCNIEKYYYR